MGNKGGTGDNHVPFLLKKNKVLLPEFITSHVFSDLWYISIAFRKPSQPPENPPVLEDFQGTVHCAPTEIPQTLFNNIIFTLGDFRISSGTCQFENGAFSVSQRFFSPLYPPILGEF
jgi:hypothetical protein